MNKQGGGEARKILTLQYEQKIEQSNTTRAARVAQGCTDDGVRMDTGTLCEWRSGEQRTYRNNDCIY